MWSKREGRGIAVKNIEISSDELRRLLGTASADAALLFLCGRSDTPPQSAGLDGTRLETAASVLRRVGLWEMPAPRFQQSSEPPVYTQADVTRALEDPASDFRKLERETQRRLGKVLSVEDLKILLSMTDYLGLPCEVISILITYCYDRSQSRGSARRPSFRVIEQEAYRWADEGIDTVETACAYVRLHTEKNIRIRNAAQVMGLDGRALTKREEDYIRSWLELGFGMEEIRLAYEKTCVNTGQLKWPYMNSILKSWDSQKLYTVTQIRQNDRPAQKKPAPQKPSDFQKHGEPLSPMMRQAIAQALADEEGEKNGVL